MTILATSSIGGYFGQFLCSGGYFLNKRLFKLYFLSVANLAIVATF